MSDQTRVGTSIEYERCDILGACSHSARRTFVTNVARKISLRSMKDVLMLARRTHLERSDM